MVGPADLTLPDTHSYACELMKVNSSYHYDYNNQAKLYAFGYPVDNRNTTDDALANANAKKLAKGHEGFKLRARVTDKITTNSRRAALNLTKRDLFV